MTPDPPGPAAVNGVYPADGGANPQTRSAHACVANQPLTATDPLGLMTISIGFGGGPCDMLAGPCDGGFGGPGPCDVTGWNPWPAPGCAGGGLGGGIGVSIIGFGGGGGGGGGGTVVGTPSGPASGAAPPCAAGICSPSDLVGSGGATADQAVPFLGTLWEITVAACGDNPACIGIVLADPEVTIPVALAGTLVYEGVKLGAQVYQASRANKAARAALAEVERICGKPLPPDASERFHEWIQNEHAQDYRALVQFGVELFCPEKAGQQ